MKVLISWSGKQSRTVALALHRWLPKVLPAVEPWISTKDIDKGSRWLDELQSVLQDAAACIVCVTPDNMDSSWLYWETGAISLAKQHKIVPLLIGLTADDIKGKPLEHYQCATDSEDELLCLVLSINHSLENPEPDIAVEGLFHRHSKELHVALKEAADLGMPKQLHDLLQGLKELERNFNRRWDSAKEATSQEAIGRLVDETATGIEQLWTSSKAGTLIVLHCRELKDSVRGVYSPSVRDEMHRRGDVISTKFEKAYAAIRSEPNAKT